MRQGKGASAMVAPVVLVLQFTSGVHFVFTHLLVARCVVGAVLAVRFFRWTPRGSV